MAEEQKQATAPSAPPRRDGGGGHGGGHSGGGHSGGGHSGGSHGGPRREGGGPGGAGPGGPRRGKRQYFRKKKVCKFCVEKMDFIDYKRARNIALLPFAGSAAGTQQPRAVVAPAPGASAGTPSSSHAATPPAAAAPSAAAPTEVSNA